MPTYTRKPLARIEPGDEVFEKTRGGIFKLLGTAVSSVKNTPRRSVTLTLVDAEGDRFGFSQNWAAKLWVKKPVEHEHEHVYDGWSPRFVLGPYERRYCACGAFQARKFQP